MRKWTIAIAAAAVIGAIAFVFWPWGGPRPAPVGSPAAALRAAGAGGSSAQDAPTRREAAARLAAVPAAVARERSTAAPDPPLAAPPDPRGEDPTADDPRGDDPGGGDDDPPPPEHLRAEVEHLRQAMERQAVLRVLEFTLAEQADRYLADLNEDGKLDLTDLAQFLQWLDAGDGRADFSGDGVLDHTDTLAFQSELAAQTRAPAPVQLAERLAITRAMAEQHEMVVFQLRAEVSTHMELLILPAPQSAPEQ